MEPTDHLCKSCGRTFPRTAQFFHSFGGRKDGLRPNCKECHRADCARWKRRNPERYSDQSKRRNRKVRLEVLTVYCGGSPACQCCGEAHVEFLALDHIDGGGLAHRRSINEEPCGHKLYRWARNNGYPPLLQVLCHNCNCAKGYYGECPHERERRAAREG